MKACAKIVGVFCVLVLTLFVSYKIAQDYGVERASRAEENSMLRKLQTATPKMVVEIWFWAINHHSKRVMKVCGGYGNGWDDVRKLELISLKAVKLNTPNEKVFAVSFKAFNRFGGQTGFDTDHIIEWTVTVRRSKKDGQWHVCNYGWC